MYLEQLFEINSSTYTYILADENSRDAIVIDPVLEDIDVLLAHLEKEGFNLSAAFDTHVHADHVTALGALRERTGCVTHLGKPGDVVCADSPLQDGQSVKFGSYLLKILATPGHTDDSYCFYLDTGSKKMLFTGDTLLIGGTGRTDFQNGDAGKLYDSLHSKLLKLEDDTIVYPGHDYNGRRSSSIGQEKKNNERIKINGRDNFIEYMANLNLPNPKQMDIAVPANKQCGKAMQF